MRKHLTFIFVTLCYVLLFTLPLLLVLITFNFKRLKTLKEALKEITEYAYEQIYEREN